MQTLPNYVLFSSLIITTYSAALDTSSMEHKQTSSLRNFNEFEFPQPRLTPWLSLVQLTTSGGAKFSLQNTDEHNGISDHNWGIYYTSYGPWSLTHSLMQEITLCWEFIGLHHEACASCAHCCVHCPNDIQNWATTEPTLTSASWH